MLQLALRPSRALCAVLAVAHAAAAITVIPLDIPDWTRLVVLAAIAASLAHTIWRHALLRSRASIVAIDFFEDDHVVVQASDGSRHEARILGTSYVSPLLSAINLRLAGRTFARHVLIVPDNADVDAFRRVRVLLRWAYRKSA